MNLRELLLAAFSNPTTNVADPAYRPAPPAPAPAAVVPAAVAQAAPTATTLNYADVQQGRLRSPSASAPRPALGDGPMTDAAVEALVNADNGPMTDASLPASITRPARPARPARAYDEAAMQALVDTLMTGDMGIVEGQNANIGDDSRARALAQVAALRG